MNFYFLSVNCVDLSIRKLHSFASFKKMSIGDLAVLRFGRRLILVIINTLKTEDAKLTDFPMVAQVICDDDNLPKLMPILYYNDGYSSKIFDIDGLYFLLNIFNSNKFAYSFIEETLALITSKIEQRDMQLTMQLFRCSTKIPATVIMNENVTNSHNLSIKGKLLIVENFFTDRIKSEFYDCISLGLTEREALIKLRRKYPKFFSRILSHFRDKDIYTRI